MQRSVNREIELPEGVPNLLTENCGDDRNKLDSEFDPSVLPKNYNKYITLEVDPSGGYIANTGPYVGVIPCRDGSFLPIKPKTGIKNLTYFLRKSGRIAQDLDSPFDDDVPYQQIVDDLIGMHELYIKQFLSQLDDIKRNGLLKSHISENIVSEQIEGRIDVSSYAMNIYQGKARQIPQKKGTQTLDNLPNKFLKLTLRRLADSKFANIDQKEIVKRLDYFRPVSEFNRADDFTKTKNRIHRLVAEHDLPPSRSYYLPALDSCLMIIEQGDISLDHEVDNEFRSFTFNMYDAFEDYIRNITRDRLQELGYDVFDGNKPAHSTDLYNSESDSNLTLKPDIVVSDGRRDVGVIDVKYKNELSNVDHYQLWSYKRQYDVNFAAFVSIPSEGSEESDRDDYNLYNGNESIFNIRFSLSDFNSSEQFYFDFLDEFLND